MEKIYALYARVSTEEQATKEGSLVSQVQRMIEYLEYNRIRDGYFVYQDEWTGKDTKGRPFFRKMIEEIKEGKIKAVVCTEISRVSRSVADFYQFLDVCQKSEVDFISLREKFDTTTPQGKLILSIFVLLAQFESDQIAERTSFNLIARLKRGLFNGGLIYGYRPRTGQKGYLDIEEGEALLVRKIYEKYLVWGSYSKITAWLNEEGYSFRKGRKWHKNTVLMILKNPSYMAKRKFEGVLIPMQWEPIIKEESWQQVQGILERNYGIRKNSRKHKERHCFLFRGLLFCGNCKTVLESCSGINHQGKKYFYYRHSSKSRKSGCSLPFCFPATETEEMLYRSILANLKDQVMIENVCNQVSGKMASDIEEEKKEGSILEKELERIESEVDGLIKSMASLPYSQVQEFIVPRLNALSERKRKAENRLTGIKTEIYRLTREQIKPDDIKEMVSFLEKDFSGVEMEEKQRLLKILVERVEIHGENWSVCMRVYNANRDRSEKVRVIPEWLPEQDSKRTFFWIKKAWFWIKKGNFLLIF